MAIAKYSLTALDCPDPLSLANFYAQITDFKVVVAHTAKDGKPLWVELVAYDQFLNGEMVDSVLTDKDFEAALAALPVM